MATRVHEDRIPWGVARYDVVSRLEEVSGSAVVGAGMLLRFHKISNGKFWDWDTGAFTDTITGNVDVDMNETDSVLVPGEYYYSFEHFSAIAAVYGSDTYVFDCYTTETGYDTFNEKYICPMQANAQNITLHLSPKNVVGEGVKFLAWRLIAGRLDPNPPTGTIEIFDEYHVSQFSISLTSSDVTNGIYSVSYATPSLSTDTHYYATLTLGNDESVTGIIVVQ